VAAANNAVKVLSYVYNRSLDFEDDLQRTRSAGSSEPGGGAHTALTRRRLAERFRRNHDALESG